MAYTKVQWYKKLKLCMKMRDGDFHSSLCIFL